jgi:hypothetical protein
VIGVALCLLADVWRDHPEVHKAEEFIRICSDQLRDEMRSGVRKAIQIAGGSQKQFDA